MWPSIIKLLLTNEFAPHNLGDRELFKTPRCFSKGALSLNKGCKILEINSQIVKKDFLWAKTIT